MDSYVNAFLGSPCDPIPCTRCCSSARHAYELVLHYIMRCQTEEDGLENASRDGVFLGGFQLPAEAVDTLLREDF